MFLVASQTAIGQIDTISNDLTKKIQDNFLEYKKYIPYPHDTISVHKEDIPGRKIENGEDITITVGRPHGKIIINARITEQDITNHVILHEITHTSKDSITKTLDYTMKDGVKLIGIN